MTDVQAPAKEEASGLDPMRVLLLALLFFCSGATGLVYEVAWSKRLELTFGATSHSIGTVLAAYMAGLGLGAWLLGRWADRPGSPARRYALLEAGIGVWALLSPWVLDGIEAIYVALGGAGGLFLKAVLGLLAILPATLLMGGTLPVLARSLVDRRGDTQRAVGLLYGINTLGAVVGTLLSGFLFLEWLGMDATSRGVGLVNLALAGIAALLGPRLAPDVQAAVARAPAPPPDSSELRAERGKVAVIATFACGLVALALEVAWTRALGLAFGSTGHGFTIMLAATLLGIGLGSLLAARVSRDERAPVGGLALAFLLLGGATYLFLAGYELLPRLFFNLAQSRVLYYEELLFALFAAATLSLLPATTALGLAFPLCSQLGTPAASEAGANVGRLYLANTLGAIAGSLLGAFTFVPLLGTEWVIALGALAAAAGGGWLAHEARRLGTWKPESSRAAAALGGTLALAALLHPRWEPASLDLAPTRLRAETFPSQPGEFQSAYQRGGSSLLYARDGINAYVTVRATGRVTSLLLGGKADASTLSDMPTQLLCGAVPFLSRPEARRALVVGAGSGVTARVVSDFPSIEQVDLIEIEDAVLEAARRFFGSVNDGALDRPKVRIVLDDARTWLLAARADQPYDVIASEPTNPSIAGVANLFTREHYENASRLLAPDGVYLQWIQLYESDEWMARAMIRTFCESFPHVDLWWTNPADLLLVGSREPLRHDPAAIRKAFAANPGLQRDLWPRLFCKDPAELLGRFLLPGEALRAIVSDGEVLHDRLPRLEGHAARARYESRVPHLFLSSVWEAHQERKEPWPVLSGEPPDPAALQLAAARQLADLPWGGGDFRVRELLLGRTDPEAVALLARTDRDPVRRREALDKALRDHPDHELLLEGSARLFLELGERDRAREPLAKLALLPGPRSARYHLMRCQVLDPLDPGHAEEIVTQAEAGLAALLPREAEMEVRSLLLARLAAAAGGAPQPAIQLLRGLATQRPEDEEAGLSLARAFLNAKQPESCLAELDLLEERNGMAWAVPARFVRLQALDKMGSNGAEAFQSELARFLRDFPDEARQPDVIRLRQTKQKKAP